LRGGTALAGALSLPYAIYAITIALSLPAPVPFGLAARAMGSRGGAAGPLSGAAGPISFAATAAAASDAAAAQLQAQVRCAVCAAAELAWLMAALPICVGCAPLPGSVRRAACLEPH
jgi:hypothetical protein